MTRSKPIKDALNRLFIFICIFLFSSFSHTADSFLEKLTVDKIPNADEAFLFSAAKLFDDRIILTWVMKENCFLYKDKFKVSFNGEELKSQNKKGKSQRINDIYFGEVEVYFDQYRPAAAQRPPLSNQEMDVGTLDLCSRQPSRLHCRTFAPGTHPG